MSKSQFFSQCVYTGSGAWTQMWRRIFRIQMGWIVGVFLLLFGTTLAAAITLPAKISLRVPTENAVEGREIPVYITIVYDPKETIDESSFQLNKQSIRVERVQAERVAPTELFQGNDAEGVAVNRYRVLLPRTSAGLYTIGPVTVRVGKATYSSDTITVNVQGAVENDNFRLEAKVQAPSAIYVGQRVVFEYKVYFRNPTQLFKEDLPLLNVDGFRLIGSPEIENGTEGNYSVQTIRQQAVAEHVGKVDVRSSLIEGMDLEDRGDEKIPVPPLRRAITQPLSLAVLPFPDIDRPASFTGALGSFVWRSSLPKGDTVPIGEMITAEYRVSGRGELQTVQFPSFANMPGIKESFWTDSTPPVGEEVDGTMRFTLTLRPKRVGVVEIPGFSFVSFDPVSSKYLTALVPPVKLTVVGSRDDERSVQEKEPVFGALLEPPFELDERSAVAPTVSSWWIPVAFLCALAGAILELIAVRKLAQKKQTVLSKDLFYKAVMNRTNKEKGLRLLEQAFYLRLFEVGITDKLEETPHAIPTDGLAGEVRQLLETIEKERFLRSQTSIVQDIFDSASLLYHRLKGLQRVSK